MREATARAATAAGPGKFAGLQVLAIFARVLSAEVLRAHADGPLTPRELEATLGWAPEASLRVATASLRDLGALERDARPRVTTCLSPAGAELLTLADELERWLSQSPFGSLELSDSPARGIVRALVGGWEAAIVRSLAERPRSLAELSRKSEGFSYPALKRRAAQMRAAKLLACPDERPRSPELEPTRWLRRATAPFSLAADWELRHAPDLSSESEYDLEAVLLLALPLVDLPSANAPGSCLFAAPRGPAFGTNGDEPDLAAVSLAMGADGAAALSSGAAPSPDTWVLGLPGAWLDAVLVGRLDDLRIRGAHSELAKQAVNGIHKALF